MKGVAVCLIGLVLVASNLPSTAGAIVGQSSRKLLQPYRRSTVNPNLASNTVRAQAATAQSIEEAVNNGGSLTATRNAGRTGAVTSWATNQRQDTFDFVDRNSGPSNTLISGR